MDNGTRPIEWAILIATIIGVIATVAQPFISYWLETRRDEKFDELKRDLEKKLGEKEKRIKNLEIEAVKEQKKNVKEVVKLVTEYLIMIEKMVKVIREKGCSNCKNKLENFFKEDLETEKKES